MRIINLIENTAGSTDCLCEHGLSFYIETKRHKLLVDTGATDAFLANAKRLGIDLTQVDTVIISHGHYDHTGGLLAFVQCNPNAQIWIQRSAGEAYFHKNDIMEKYIGIAPQIKQLRQIKWIEGNCRIDEELFLFSGVTERRLWPLGNRELKVKRENQFYQDEFVHEQYLVLETENRKILISGCAHNGILNILEAYRKLYGAAPDVVISGFHMRKKSGYTKEDLEIVRKIGTELKTWNTVFYTGHCTGEEPYQILKECMAEQLYYVHSGEEVKCCSL